MSKTIAKDMSEQEVIDFLVKCGMWVEDGKIAKSDVDKAVSLLQRTESSAEFSITITVSKEVYEDLETEANSKDMSVEDLVTDLIGNR